MARESPFEGFPKDALTFLRGLEKNNDKGWFAENRERYDNAIVEPSKAFVVAMGTRLRKLAPEIEYVPKVNGSLFRINRDTRFSADKSPYKTNIGILFWEGAGKRMENSGYYFHLEPRSLMLGAGIYMFSKPMLEAYREAVVDPKLGPALGKALRKVPAEMLGKTGCGMTTDRYKKVPKGFDPEHPRAELLKNKGLTAGIELKIPKELHGPELVDFCYDRFKLMAPLHRWLVQTTATA